MEERADPMGGFHSQNKKGMETEKWKGFQANSELNRSWGTEFRPEEGPIAEALQNGDSGF